MEKEYMMSSLDEYFSILDRETQRRSLTVAKTLVKYIQKTKECEEKLKEIAAY
jgi:hypothetical protein